MVGYRFLMRAGKQRELVELARESFSSWHELSRELGINENYLCCEIRTEKRTISDTVYGKLCKIVNKNYDRYVVKKLDQNWGRLKGAERSPRTKIKTVGGVDASSELAEICGIVLGDGNIYHKQYALRICGSLIDENDYINIHVSGLLKKVFGVDAKVYYHKKMNEIILYVYSKFVVDNLERHGLHPGDKMKNNVGIPEWITKNEKYTIPCIRGLFDTDGCVFKSKGKVRIEFYSAIPKLRLSVKNAMDGLGFCSTWKVKKGRKTQTYGLYSASDVTRFINIVGFNNPKYRMRASMV